MPTPTPTPMDAPCERPEELCGPWPAAVALEVAAAALASTAVLAEPAGRGPGGGALEVEAPVVVLVRLSVVEVTNVVDVAAAAEDVVGLVEEP